MEFQRFNQAQASTQAASYDQGLRSYMLGVYNYMASGLALTGIVAMFVASQEAMIQALVTNKILFFGLMIAELGLVVYLGARIFKMSFGQAQGVYWLYAALNGVTLSVLLYAFTGESVARTFFITASLFGVMSLIGYSTKKDLTGMGHFMIMGVIGIIIASIVNLFLGSSMLHFIISVVGVIAFTGLTAYDTQRIKQVYYALGGADGQTMGKAAISGALTLYLDFINLFIMLLQFFGDRR